MIETYKFERFVRVFMFVCLCLCLWNRLFLFLAHKSLAISRYELTNRSILNADMRATLVRGMPGLCFCDRNLSDCLSLKLMSSRDLEKVFVDVKIYSSYVRME